VTDGPRLKGPRIYTGVRFPVWVFLPPVRFITSIHCTCIPLAIKYSVTALTCSPCTMICFNSGLREIGCTFVEDAHAIFSPSARLSASRRKISKPDMYVIVWLWRRMVLTEIGCGIPSLGGYKQPERRSKERTTDLMIGWLLPIEILYHAFAPLKILLITSLVCTNFFFRSSALLSSFPFKTISRRSLSWVTSTKYGSCGLNRFFDARYWLMMVLISFFVKSSSGLVWSESQKSCE